MPHTETHLRHHSSGVHLFGFALETTAAAVAACKAWQRTVSTRRAIADLPPERLKDIGHAETPVPVLEVKAGLITTLLSMR